MRWNQQSSLAPATGASAASTMAASAAAPPAELFGVKGLLRSVRTPEFAGVTFHEVLAKSALNKVPAASSMPFTWTINPYRGCSHACVYCFARSTHRYLDLDAGQEVAETVGIDADDARRILSSDEYTAEVKADIAEARSLGANGVPFFVIDRKYGISGAQPPEAFARALETAWGESQKLTVLADGAVCGPEGCD